MNNHLVTKEHESVAEFHKTLDNLLHNLESVIRDHKPLLDGERYLTDKEVSKLLKISRRTLQDYRDSGRIPYCQLGGKILYRESDLEKMLADSYREAFR